MMDRTQLKGYGAFALVFVLGLLIGGAGSRAMLQRRYARLFKDRFAVFEHRRLGALARRLDLDDAQEDKVRAIMSKYGQQRRELTREIMDRCGAPLRAQKSQMDSEIRTVLRPEQQSRYDSLVHDSNSHPPPGDSGGPLEPLP
jgi:Spy/CpxP family protein refolding chaperone